MQKEFLINNMSENPYQVSSQTCARKAFQFMQDNDIRHLPVVNDGVLVGVVSDRDLRQALNQKDEILVWSLMSRNPYVVKEGEPIEKVVHEMHRKKYGCSIIVDDLNWVTGIFTTIDALVLLEKLLLDNGPTEKRSFGFIEDYLVRNTARPCAV